MTFLNPLILAGLLAVSIPILIHLLNLSKVRRVEFSTLRFLKELQKSKMKKIKLRQLLLLALRVMAVIFLVLAFADPVLKSSSAGYAGKSAAVVILDNSYSMSAENNEIFENGKKAAKDIISQLDDDDDIYFLLSSDIGNKSSSIVTYDKSTINTIIDSAEISLKPLRVEEAIMVSATALSNSSFSVKDLFLISDMQRISFGKKIMTETAQFEYPVTVFAIGCGKDDLNNISVDSSEIRSVLSSGEVDSDLKVKINNISEFSQNGIGLKTTVNGNFAADNFLDVNSFSSKDVDVKIQLTGEEENKVEFLLDRKSIEDDQLIIDNKNYLLIASPSLVNVLLSGSDQIQRTYIELALETIGNGEQAYFSTENAQLNDASLAGKDVAILYNVNELTASESDALRRFIEAGGGVLIFPGDDLNFELLNESLLSLSGGMRIAGKRAGSGELYSAFGKIDFDHPVLRGIFRNKELSATSDASMIESPKITGHYKTAVSEDAKPVIMLENGEPFLTDFEFGKGRIMFFSVSLSPSMSDLPQKSIFVPILVRSVNHLAGNLMTEEIYYAGEQNLLRLRGIENISKIIGPSGSTDSTLYALSGGSEKFLNLPYSELTSQAGFYTAVDSSGNEFVFALNANPVESDLSIFSGDEVEEFFAGRGLSQIVYADWDEADTIYESSKKGSQLWKYFIALALLALAAEKFLSRKLEKGE